MSETTAVTIFVCPPGCRCECATGGPCRHAWDSWVREQLPSGATQGSAACSRCGMTAMAHDLRVLP